MLIVRFEGQNSNVSTTVPCGAFIAPSAAFPISTAGQLGSCRILIIKVMTRRQQVSGIDCQILCLEESVPRSLRLFLPDTTAHRSGSAYVVAENVFSMRTFTQERVKVPRSHPNSQRL